MRCLIFFLPYLLWADHPLIPQSMLFQAETVSRQYTQLLAKAPPPSLKPNTGKLLRTTSQWLVVDLQNHPLNSLTNERLWEDLVEIGFDGLDLKHLKSSSQWGIDPHWATIGDYRALQALAKKRGISLLGSLIGPSTGKGIDFALALKNVGDFPSLYSLIEIPESDWPLLPVAEGKTFTANIPWLMVQTLHKKGYIPERFNPYVKQSEWNATQPIRGADQKERRWIYLRDKRGDPTLDWMSPTFAAEKLSLGDALQGGKELGQTVFRIDSELPLNVQETFCLFLRKGDFFSWVSAPKTMKELKGHKGDLIEDPFLPWAAGQALLTQNTEALRVAYRWLIQEHIRASSLLHRLPSLKPLFYPLKKGSYSQEEITQEALLERLLNVEIDSFQHPPFPGPEETLLPKSGQRRSTEELLQLQLSLSRFLAWQPGAFAIDLDDLLGIVGEKRLYANLPIQMTNQHSYAKQLQQIFAVREETNLCEGQLVEVVKTSNPATLILRYELPNGLNALSAWNVSDRPVREQIEGDYLAKVNVLNWATQLGESKPFDSSLMEIILEPFEMKFLLLQNKHFLDN